jgi:hypothetical protein
MPTVRCIVPRKKQRTFWAQTETGREHARRTISAFNGSPEGKSHAETQLHRWLNDPAVVLRKRRRWGGSWRR